MNPSFNPSSPDFEERMDAWLTRQPITPAPDFVVRTMARIRAEASLVTAARAGDDAALDTLLDHWLGEQSVESDFEPDQLAISTRRTSTREEEEESTPVEAPGRRIILFPTWARSAAALAAAACVALLGYLNLNGPVGNLNLAVVPANNVVASLPANDLPGDTVPTAHYAWNSDRNYIADLSTSFKDLASVTNSTDLDSITREFGSDDAVN